MTLLGGDSMHKFNELVLFLGLELFLFGIAIATDFFPLLLVMTVVMGIEMLLFIFYVAWKVLEILWKW